MERRGGEEAVNILLLLVDELERKQEDLIIISSKLISQQHPKSGNNIRPEGSLLLVVKGVDYRFSLLNAKTKRPESRKNKNFFFRSSVHESYFIQRPYSRPTDSSCGWAQNQAEKRESAWTGILSTHCRIVTATCNFGDSEFSSLAFNFSRLYLGEEEG
ncbi:unnamed protein product [Dovyalis caffra]|uniref:Uncharacterized protein n=1 Tax=Dovyalis caffra TaxID=77055 RepID=A0AAV1S9U2_9ROSI|nr:unnamed protein product [Dovyalis caffra]